MSVTVVGRRASVGAISGLALASSSVPVPMNSSSGVSNSSFGVLSDGGGTAKLVARWVIGLENLGVCVVGHVGSTAVGSAGVSVAASSSCGVGGSPIVASVAPSGPGVH